MMSDLIRVPLLRKPDLETQRLIEEGKIVRIFATTGTINPGSKGIRPGVYYQRIDEHSACINGMNKGWDL